MIKENLYCPGALRCRSVCSGLPCEICGFNPKEQKRRIETGEFRDKVVTSVLHSDTGEVVSTITRKCKKLYFKGVLGNV